MAEAAFAGRRVLITGGLGFIGSNLARRLVELEAQVTLVDSLVPEYGGNLFNIAGIEDRVRVNVSDVRDQYSFGFLIREVDYLFNLAGQTSHVDSMAQPETDLEINCRAQLSILEACRKYNPRVKVVFASTRQIYGRPERLPVDEKHPLRPVDVNGINKMAGEFYHLLYNDVHAIRACSLRLTNTIGPRMRIKDDRQTFLGYWLRRILENEPIEVWGGEQQRDFTYIDDAVEAFLLAAASEAANGQIFNIGGTEVIRLDALAELLVELNGGGAFTLRPYPGERRRIDIGSYYADSSKASARIGWKPTTSLRDALARTLSYYREHFREYV